METMFSQHDAWRQQRLGKFTSSENHRLFTGGKRPMTPEELAIEKANKGRRTTVDTVFGDGAMTYIYEKLAEIITGESKDDISGLKALEWGAAHENDGVLTFERQTGKKVEYFGVATPRFFPYNAYSGGSPDGLTADAVLEIKCPFTSSTHIDFLIASLAGQGNAWLKSNKPDYYTQLQFNMLCCQRPLGYLASYDPRTIEYAHRLAILTITPDPEHQQAIIYRLEEAAKIISESLRMLEGRPKPSTLIITPVSSTMMLVEDANALKI